MTIQPRKPQGGRGGMERTEMRDSLGLTATDYKRLKIQQKVGNLLNAKLTKPTYIAKFGPERTKRLLAVKEDRIRWMDECNDILLEDFHEFFQNYRFTPPAQPQAGPKRIWVCWLQGEAHMPDVVKLCIRSLRKNAPAGAEVVLLTGENIGKFVQFPDYVYKNLKSGRLTLTHFSDLLRMNLLRTYGGFWVDSTVFVSAPIPPEYMDGRLYSIQMYGKEDRDKNPYYGGLTSFLFSGSTQCLLFDFCYRFFLEYQKKYGHLIDVHPINLCFRMAYDRFPEMRAAIDAIGPNNRDVYTLFDYTAAPYSPEQWKKLTDGQIFHKLNWRKHYPETVDGKMTVYGYMQSIT